jgi:hypothetical protein
VKEIKIAEGERLERLSVPFMKIQDAIKDLRITEMVSILSSITAKVCVLNSRTYNVDFKEFVGDFSTLLLHSIKEYEQAIPKGEK